MKNLFYIIRFTENKKEASPSLDSLLRALNRMPNASKYSIYQDINFVNTDNGEV